LPDPPLECVDLPKTLPPITQKELVKVADAHRRFEIAKAYYEAERATLKLKLLQLCQPESGSYGATLCEDGRILLTDSCSEGKADIFLL